MSELFACVRLEFTRPLGPSEGRYVVSFGTPDATGPDVLDVRAVTARVVPVGHRRSRLSDRAEAELSLVRYTLVRASKPMAETAAAAWLASCRRDIDVRARVTERALEVLNTAIRAYRVAAGDPYAVEVTEADALAVGFGVGTARQVFDGDELAWVSHQQTRAHGTADRLGPARAVADALAGRARPQAANDLVLRALLDLRHGSPRSAAASLLAALEVITADADFADPELLGRTRSTARATLSRAVSSAEHQAMLRVLAVELRERLQVAVPQDPGKGLSTVNDSRKSSSQLIEVAS